MHVFMVLLGLSTMAVVWPPPPLLVTLAGPFSAHMMTHMGIVAVAAPLIALGLAGTRLDPVRRSPRPFAAIPASVVELVVVWGWHSPALHQAARHSSLGFVLEQSTFLVSGLWLWLSVFAGAEPERSQRTAIGVVALLLTSMHMTLLGALLALAPRPLYAHPAHALHHGLGPLEDQQLGGAIMLLIGGLSYLLGGLWLAAGLLRRGSPRGALVASNVSDLRSRTDLEKAEVPS